MKTFLPSFVWALLLAITAYAEDAQFVSTGKLLVPGAGFGPKPEIGEPVPDSFYNTVCEIAMGARMHNRAAERVHALHPGLAPEDLLVGHAVKIKAARSPNTSIVVVSVTSPEEVFGYAMTDAVMDELFATWKEIKDNRYQMQTVVTQDHMVAVEKDIQHLEEELTQAEREKAEPATLAKVKARLKHSNKRYEALVTRIEALNDARDLTLDAFTVIEHASKPKKVEKAP